MHTTTAAVALYVFGCLPVLANDSSDITKFPQSIDSSCNFGRAKLYDECGSQTQIFASALQDANVNGKTLLVSFGAEWCIWCHVFDQYVEGSHTAMNYRAARPGDARYDDFTLYERPPTDPQEAAVALNDFVASNFVIVHIETGFSPDGLDVLEQAGAMEHYSGGLPFIFTVSDGGEYADQLVPKNVETRRDTDDWYRGYDRSSLTGELQRMLDAAS